MFLVVASPCLSFCQVFAERGSHAFKLHQSSQPLPHSNMKPLHAFAYAAIVYCLHGEKDLIVVNPVIHLFTHVMGYSM